MPIPSNDTRLHNQLMRAADSSKGFFPPGAEIPGPSTSKALPTQTGASFIPDVSPRPRKLSTGNKLLKRRPPLRAGSTPPTSFRGNTPGKDDAFIEAVVSTVEMIAPKPKKKTSKDDRPLAERSFFSRTEPWEERSGGAPRPTTSQNSDPTSSTDSSASMSSLKKSSSFVQPGGPDYRSPATPPDPFGRRPPVTIVRPSPSPTRAVRPGEIFGSAITRYPAEDASIKKWTPRENRGTVIALYKPPEMGPKDSSQFRSNGGATSEEKDNTIIALYKPPQPQPQTGQQHTSPQFPPPRNAQRQRSNTLAGVPGSPIDNRAPSSMPQGVPSVPINRSGPSASNTPPPPLIPLSRTRSNTVGSGPDGDRQQSAPPLNLSRSYSCELII